MDLDMANNDSETFGDDFSLESDGSLEDSSPSPSDEYVCKICRDKLCKPRLLSCLHTFCEACIDKQLVDASGESKGGDHVVLCPECHQETTMAEKGASSLPSNYVMNNMLDMCAIQEMAVVCTSCKTKELAVSRCSDCAHFLCPHCNTAHQFMRCFEDHRVVPFEELRKSASEPSKAIPIHKPIFCNSHPSESLKYFCHTCRIPICNDCMVSDHVAPQHRYERLADAAPRLKDELETLMGEAKKKAALYQDASADLENALSDLQAQHDAAQDLIKETYQSYKAILEKCKDDALRNLRVMHKENELKIMDSYHIVEKTMDKVADACKFTSQLLKHGNAVELTSLRNVVSAQLQNIVGDSPEPEINTSLEFVTDLSTFQQAVQATFGTLRCNEASPGCTSSEYRNGPFPPPPPPPPALSLLSLSTPGLPAQPVNVSASLVNGREDSSPSPTFSTISSISNGDRSASASTRNVSSAFVATTAASLMNGFGSSVASSPVSMHSSYDSEISQITGYGMPPPETPPIPTPTIPPVAQNSICGLTSIQEYNLTQLASLADKVDVETVRSVAASPTPSMSLNDLLAGPMGPQNHALNNLQALAKLGGMALTDRDMPNESMNGGSGLMGRGHTSPPPMALPSPTSSSNNNFNMLPTDSTPPILNQQGGEDHLPDSMNMGSGFGGSVSPMFPMSTASFPIERDPNNKVMAMQVRLKFGSMGSGKGQFSSPHGFCLGCDEDIVVADTNNHRIQVFDRTGTFKFQFGVAGKEEGQLYYPRKVAVIRSSGKFVVCDRGNERSRLQIFTKNGHFVRKIAIRYIEILAGLAVTASGHIVAVDSVSPTVFVISENGGITTWFNCSDYMMEPSDITVSGNEFFVCDFKGHAVVVFDENGKFKRRIGHEPVTNYPNGIDISDAGDVVVGDSHGNRFHVVVFNRKGDKLSEFECPYVKVSRCCGLKITSDGYVVTLAKNNHYVLVLNTLYIH